jgi:hypothetical protein
MSIVLWVQTTALAKANRIANEFMDYVWETRDYVSEINKSIPEAIQIALQHQQGKVYSMNPSTHHDIAASQTEVQTRNRVP